MGQMPEQSSGTAPEALWLDLGEFGKMNCFGSPLEQFQDHGLGLLRTVCARSGLNTRVASLRAMSDWDQFDQAIRNLDVLCLNVRSYNLTLAMEAARRFKKVNKDGRIVTGGMHATIAPEEMLGCEDFDVVCSGSGENLIVDIIKAGSGPREISGIGVRELDQLPWLDRELWPRPLDDSSEFAYTWPLEPACGWGPPPIATILSSRMCPWRCAFCNEASYIPHAQRRSVESVIDELNYLDRRYGVGSVVFHDSLFFQHPSWLVEWLEQYPRRARKLWPYWAAARSDLATRWPELFLSLIRETNWSTISIGFESGSDRVLKILNKECTLDQNLAVIGMVNRVGDEMEASGKSAPQFWANIMLGIPGENPGEAIDTMAMLKCMRRVQPSFSYFTAYPGTVLGNQIIAEGKSRQVSVPERYPEGEKALGIDYEFYVKLRAGKLDKEVEQAARRMKLRMQQLYTEPPARGESSHLYLLTRIDGSHVLSCGMDAEDAIANWKTRQTDEVRGEFDRSRCKRIRQQDMHLHSDRLS